MTKKIAILFFLFSFLNTIFAQPINIQSDKKGNIPTLSQVEIDQLAPTDGLVVFNTTSGCLNYFFSNNWFEVCGKCTPQPTIAKIDTILQIGNLLKIKFQPIKNAIVSFKIDTEQDWIQAEDSLASVPVPVNKGIINLLLKTTNNCGSIDTTISVKIKTLVIGSVEMIKINGKDIATRKIGTTRWMCEDYIPPSAKIISKEQPTFLTLTDDKNVCPSGWSVPSISDWEQLLSCFTENNSQLFLKPTNENTSIGLGTNGLYSVEENKFYAPEAAYYWVKGKTTEKQNLLSITKNGHAFLSEKGEKAAMPLRCVSY